MIEIKIGLHKKAASLMNSNQLNGHHSASTEPTNLLDFGKNNIQKNLKSGLESQK